MSDYVLRPLNQAARIRMTHNRDTRKSSPFSANWSSTTTLLDAEVEKLQGRFKTDKYVLMVNADESKVRKDGELRADSKRLGPEAAVSFQGDGGPLLFVCDSFHRFEDNVRAIALGLEALRKVTRYGLGSGNEQYRGFGELGTGGGLATSGPAGDPAMSRHEAATFLTTWSGCGTLAILDDSDFALKAYRQASLRLHPDTSGSTPELFRQLQDARKALEF